MKRIISFVCVAVLSLFLNFGYCLAGEVGSELNKNYAAQNDSNNTKDNNREKTNKPNVSNEDIFGDEQAFPFVAGLGKNAAH